MHDYPYLYTLWDADNLKQWKTKTIKMWTTLTFLTSLWLNISTLLFHHFYLFLHLWRSHCTGVLNQGESLNFTTCVHVTDLEEEDGIEHGEESKEHPEDKIPIKSNVILNLPRSSHSWNKVINHILFWSISCPWKSLRGTVHLSKPVFWSCPPS